MSDADFYEEDEPASKIEKIWNRPGKKGRTVKPPRADQYETYLNPENLRPAGPAIVLPRKPLDTHVPVRFPPETIAQVKELAARKDTTVSEWIRKEIDKAIRRS